jgi:ATP-dependent Zn protease
VCCCSYVYNDKQQEKQQEKQMTFDWGTSGALSMSIHSQKKRGKNKKTTINRTEFSPFSHKSTWFCFVLFCFFFSFLFASFGGRKKERKQNKRQVLLAGLLRSSVTRT